MAAPVILVEAMPRRPGDGATVAVRLAGGGDRYPYHYLGQHWRAGITGLPRSLTSLDHDGEQLGGGHVAQAMAVRWAPPSDAALAELGALYWGDAAVIVRIGPEGEVAPPIETTGLILDTLVQDGQLQIALADQAPSLRRPLLTERYAGTGDLEGPPEWKDLLKSRAWGRCFNVPGRCIDPAYNIWVFGDPTRPWQAFHQVRDRGAAAAALAPVNWHGSMAATLQALRTAAAPEGGGLICPSLAAVRWWTEPAGDLHADISGETAGGYVQTAPEIVARIVAASSDLPFAAGAVAAAAAARPMAFGWRVEGEAATAAGEISAILGDVSLSWVIANDAIEFRRWEWSAPVRVAQSEGVSRRETYKPVAARRLGYRRNQAPMSRGDLAAAVLLGLAAPLLLTEWSADGLDGWHADYLAGIDFYYRQSNDDGLTWGPAIRGVADEPPPLIILEATQTSAKYNAADVYVGGSIRFGATRHNAPATPLFTIVRVSDNSALLGPDVASGFAAYSPDFAGSGGDVLIMNAAIIAAVIGSYGTFRVEASVPGGVHSVSIPKVKDGSNGLNGAPGYNNASVPIYQRGASAPALPSAETTYTFATAGLAGLNNGWSTTIPAGTDPLWASAATASATTATDTIAAAEWSAARQIARTGDTGAHGLNVKSQFIYQRAASAPALPSATATYTFSTSALAGLNNGWSTAIPAGTLPIWVTTATALSTTDTDGIEPGEWAAVRVLAQNGEPGDDGIAIEAGAASLLFLATYAGELKAGQLDKTVKFTLRKGGADISSGATWSVVTGGCTAAIGGTGAVTFSAMSASGYVRATATYAGKEYRVDVPTELRRDNAPPQSTYQQGASLTGSPGPAFPASPQAFVTVPASDAGFVRGEVAAAYGIDSTSYQEDAWVGTFAFGYRPATGGPWSFFSGGSSAGSPAFVSNIPGEERSNQGAIAFTQNQGGLTPGASYHVGVFVRGASIYGRDATASVYGDFTGVRP